MDPDFKFPTTPEEVLKLGQELELLVKSLARSELPGLVAMAVFLNRMASRLGENHLRLTHDLTRARRQASAPHGGLTESPPVCSIWSKMEAVAAELDERCTGWNGAAETLAALSERVRQAAISRGATLED
jgi:hypothetical protein